MDDVTLFIKLVKKEFPELRFGKGVGTSPTSVVVFSRDREVEKYCRQVRNFLGGTKVFHLIFLPERTYPEPKPEKPSFLDKFVDHFSYFSLFKLLKRKNPQK